MVKQLQPSLITDRKVICGSANLNDRSMRGDRDSEVAVVIEGPLNRDSHMHGSPVLPNLKEGTNNSTKCLTLLHHFDAN